MGYEIKAAGENDEDLFVVSDRQDEPGLAPDDEAEVTGDDTNNVVGEPENWPAMFDGLSDDQRDDLLKVLAQAWAGNLDRPESDDDVLIDTVLEEVGQDGFAKIITTVEGFPRTVGGLLLTAIFLDSAADRIVKLTRYKLREVSATATAIHDQVLHGAVDDARTAAVDALTNLHKSLAVTMQKNRLAGRLRLQADNLRMETSALLQTLDAPVPADEGKRKR